MFSCFHKMDSCFPFNMPLLKMRVDDAAGDISGRPSVTADAALGVAGPAAEAVVVLALCGWAAGAYTRPLLSST